MGVRRREFIRLRGWLGKGDMAGFAGAVRWRITYV